MHIYMAPMEGVVDFHMRKIFSSLGGIDCYVTEFIRVSQTRLPRKVFVRSCPELLSENRFLAPTRIQLLGSDINLLADNARKAAKLGSPGIDLNFGCPAKAVNRNRGGACLLDETELIHDIVHAVRKAVPAEIPVSAKIRLGFNDRDSYLANAMAISDAGADQLFVHARSKSDGYAPPAYWSNIGEIVKSIDIPVVANGEIWSLDDYQRCKEQSLCTDVMLGRGLLARPDLALQIKHAERSSISGDKYTVLTWPEIVNKLIEFFEATSASYPAKFMGNRLKQWLHYLQLTYPDAKRLFDTLKRLKDYDKIRALLINELR
ncbi:MAG: tRNA-dihydrouridine synthase C [Flavobacteriales bacterium]|jgi:tRNA-dihydrouridine synthase C